MSCDWDVWCLDCSSGHGFSEANHERELMRDVAARGPVLADIAGLVARFDDVRGYIEPTFSLRSGNGYYALRVDLGWFGKHGSHRLVARNEYGDNDDECGERYRCGECKASKTCRRPYDHDGGHAEEREAPGRYKPRGTP